MYSKVKMSTLTAVAAVLALSAGAAAQAQSIVPQGPVQLQGHVSVDNRPVGGDYEFFNCKVTAQGRTVPTAPGVIAIESVQALNNGSGEIPMGCATVNMTDTNGNSTLPWTLVITGSPSVDPDFPFVQAYSATLMGVGFYSPNANGDGCEGNIAGTWYENDIGSDVPPLGDFAHPSYSRFVATPGAMGPGNCVINDLHIKINVPTAPRMIN